MRCFDDDALKTLDPAFCGDKEFIVEQVNTGEAQLYKIANSETGEFYCYQVLRYEKSYDGIELVLVAVAGKKSKLWMPLIIQWAERQNFKSIRFHSNVKNIDKLVKQYGFEQKEVVYKLEL